MDNMVNLSIRCIFCGLATEVEAPAEGYARWTAGENMQIALPTLSPDQRELLGACICPQCWGSGLPEEE